MKRILRLLLGLWLITAISGCSFLQALPTIPPGWTITPSLEPTSTPSPIPTATLTPQPVVRVENGDHAYFNGDYDLALALYQTAYQDSSDPRVRSAAKWGEARTLYARNRLNDALTALQTLITQFPDSAHVPEAYFLKGEVQNQLQNYSEAANDWQLYVTLDPNVLDSYTQELRGDALFAAGSYSDALAAYIAASQAPHIGDGIQLDIKTAQTRVELGDYANALALYDGITARTTNDYIKAQAAYLSGQVYQKLGQNDEAYARFHLAVENYPLSYYAYLSLVELVNAKAEVSDLDRGIVDYYAGQYDVALAALDRYIAATPVNDGTPHYYRALTLESLNNYQGAVDEFSNFITNYSNHPKWVEAWSDKANIQWLDLNLYSEAVKTLTDYAGLYPSSADSPNYLMTAARILESNDHLDEAAQTWAGVADLYPANELAPTAIFEAGIVRFRQGNYQAARDAFTRSLALSLQKENQARAYLWIGKAQQKLGDTDAMQKSWQQGLNLDPGGYYSERQRDLLNGQAPFTAPVFSNLNVDLQAERAAADAWMRITFKLPADADLNDPGSLSQDPRFVRGTELWNLGLYDDARFEFEDLRNSVSGDAVQSYRLGNYLLSLGLYRPAIFAIRQTLTLAGLNDLNESMMAPPYFSHVRYGLYYPDLIIPDAQAEGFDPLFMFSVVRQESLFEGFVRSTAGARGLMQIVPSTGAGIASALGWPAFYAADDLYRPIISIKFGAHYLAANRNLLGGNLYAMLAAYNGGPGNALEWEKLSANDPDLFLEVVRFEETRQYIRSIYEIYVVYCRLYGQTIQ